MVVIITIIIFILKSLSPWCFCIFMDFDVYFCALLLFFSIMNLHVWLDFDFCFQC